MSIIICLNKLFVPFSLASPSEIHIPIMLIFKKKKIQIDFVKFPNILTIPFLSPLLLVSSLDFYLQACVFSLYFQ